MTTDEQVNAEGKDEAPRIRVTCPVCDKSYSAAVTAIGRKLKCTCGHSFVAESPDTSQTYELAEPTDPTPPPQVTTPTLTIPCAQHTQVMAIAKCVQCNAGVCATCDFAYPGGVHLCPTCATNPVVRLSPKRRNLAIWSIVLAAVATISLTMAFVSYAFVADEVAATGLDMLFTVGAFVSSLVGLGIGLSARSRHAGNPAITYIGWIWSSIILAIYGLLVVVGIFVGG